MGQLIRAGDARLFIAVISFLVIGFVAARSSNDDVVAIGEDMWEDLRENTEIKLVKNEDGLIEYVAGLDKTTGTLIMYSPQKEECYVMKKAEGDDTEGESTEDEDLFDGVTVPDQLKTYCQEKQLFRLPDYYADNESTEKRFLGDLFRNLIDKGIQSIGEGIKEGVNHYFGLNE